ncbi:MAG TPA: hypothetical protein VFF29_07450 [Bacteroidota bacterium]|nr:hypothetical protein [Bacteroidota bacterium]
MPACAGMTKEEKFEIRDSVICLDFTPGYYTGVAGLARKGNLNSDLEVITHNGK